MLSHLAEALGLQRRVQEAHRVAQRAMADLDAMRKGGFAELPLVLCAAEACLAVGDEALAQDDSERAAEHIQRQARGLAEYEMLDQFMPNAPGPSRLEKLRAALGATAPG